MLIVILSNYLWRQKTNLHCDRSRKDGDEPFDL